MRELLERLSKETIINFLLEYAESNTKFANAVSVRFRKPEFDEELCKIEIEIDDALAEVSDYSDRDSWGNINFDVGDIYSEIWERLEQGHIRLAFAEIGLLYSKLLEIFEYQGECEVSDETEYCLKIMSDIADKAVLDEDKAFIFDECIKLADIRDGKDYGADYEDSLLGISARFVTPERRPELERALESYKNSWRGQEFALIEHEIIRKLDGDKAGDGFISKNLHFPKIREMALEKAISSENFSEAETLCIEALSDVKNNYGISPWLYRLYSIYEMTGNTAKMAETAETIFFGGDFQYYDKLKTTRMELGEWDACYPELLIKSKTKLSTGSYMRVLEKESEYALLLGHLKEHPEMVHQFGLSLVEMYPSDVWTIFSGQINKEAEATSSRKMYQSVCARLRKFIEAGYQADVVEIISDLKTKHKRKPAFIDELSML
jgi:hypothetical protein